MAKSCKKLLGKPKIVLYFVLFMTSFVTILRKSQFNGVEERHTLQCDEFVYASFWAWSSACEAVFPAPFSLPILGYGNASESS